MKILLILIILFYAPNNYQKKADRIKNDSLLKREIQESENVKNYQKTIEFIKLKEGFSSVQYDDGGYPAIGYGQRLKFFKELIGDTITKEEANIILVIRFENDMKMVKKLWPRLNYNQVLSVAHISYTLGIGTVIYKGLLKDGILNKEKLLSFPYKEVRKFELDLFNAVNYKGYY